MHRPILLIVLTITLAGGCSAPVAVPTSPPPEATAVSLFEEAEATETESAPTQAVIGGTSVVDKCRNPLYPVHNGAWWMYAFSNGSKPSQTLSVVGNNTFILTVQSDDSTFTLEGRCTDDGIILLDVPGASVTYSGGQGSSTLIAQNVAGVTLPNDVQVGEDWSQTLQVAGGNVNATIETSYRAIGYETITVPAGSFNALKIEQNGLVTMGGKTLNSHAFFWYAQDVGVVKSVIDGVSSSELIAYNFP